MEVACTCSAESRGANRRIRSKMIKGCHTQPMKHDAPSEQVSTEGQIRQPMEGETAQLRKEMNMIKRNKKKSCKEVRSCRNKIV